MLSALLVLECFVFKILFVCAPKLLLSSLFFMIFSFSLLLFLLFCVYTGAEIQAKKKEKKENFPQFGLEDLNYDHMYRYIIDWIEKNMKPIKPNFRGLPLKR